MNNEKKKMPIWAIVLIITGGVFFAVILFIVIGALIAAPIVTGTIDDAKIAAAKASAYNLISSVDNRELMIEAGLEGESIVENNRVYCSSNSECSSKLSNVASGNIPSKVNLNYNDKITDGCIEYDNIVITITNGTASYDKNATCN